MKFGKKLHYVYVDVPELGGHLVRYKLLKKQLKKSTPADTASATQRGDLQGVAEDVEERSSSGLCAEASGAFWPSSDGRLAVQEDGAFLEMLSEDLQGINDLYIEKEEVYVIKMNVLKGRLDEAKSREDFVRLHSSFVHFHGELVHLINWSQLNYAAVSKILKKHDKLKKSELKRLGLSKVSNMPFCSTDTVSKLATEAKDIVTELEEKAGLDAPLDNWVMATTRVEDVVNYSESVKGKRLRRTQTALGIWKDLQEKAATPSFLALGTEVAFPSVLDVGEEVVPSKQARLS